MKKMILCVITIFTLLSPLTTAQNLLDQPEGVVYDYAHNRYLVTNWNGRSIVAIDTLGQMSYFKEDVGTCSDLIIDGNTLYTNSNNAFLLGFDLETGEEVYSLVLGSLNTHGIAKDSAGYFYVADWGMDVIHQIDITTNTVTRLTFPGMVNPDGLHYDVDNHRLIVCCWGDVITLGAADLTTLSFTDLDPSLSSMDGDDIAVDDDGNYYISVWNSSLSRIYKYDSDFTLPGTQILQDGHHFLMDLFYNTDKNVLAYTRYNLDAFDELQQKIIVDCDTTYGWSPLDVNFSGTCDYDVSSWDWNFHDGGSASVQNPLHTFVNSGIYDVSLDAVTTDGDTLHRSMRNYIVVLADTLDGDTAVGLPNESVAVTVSLNNTVPINDIKIPFVYQGSLFLTFDSFSTVGCRTDYFSNQSLLQHNATGKKGAIQIKTAADGSQQEIPAGEGPVLKIYFTLHSSAKPGVLTNIVMDGYSDGYTDFFPQVKGSMVSYDPGINSGAVVVYTPPCCQNDRGNINMDTEDALDISDIVFFIDYMFNQGDEPTCIEEADVVVDGTLDISDLVYMIDYMFNNGDPMPSCVL